MAYAVGAPPAGPRPAEGDSEEFQLSPPGSMRRCASVPAALSSGTFEEESQCGGMDVFVVLRPLREFGGPLYNNLPTAVKHGLRDLGVCHYMTVFRSAAGECVQFDFGPLGGDIAKVGVRDRFARIPSGSLDTEGTDILSSRERRVRGEIREEKLEEGLPEDHMFVGRTRVTLEEVRSYNSVQPSLYELNQNDCRHYVNNVVRFTTGVERASTELTRYALRERKGGDLGWNDKLIALGQHVTDVHNWSVVVRARNATVGAAAAATGMRVLPKSLVTGRLLPAAARLPVRFVPPPAMAAFATAAASCGESRLVRDVFSVGGAVADGFRATLSVAEHAVCATASATGQTVVGAAGGFTGVVKATARATTAAAGAMFPPGVGAQGLRTVAQKSAGQGTVRLAGKALHRLSVGRAPSMPSVGRAVALRR